MKSRHHLNLLIATLSLLLAASVNTFAQSDNELIFANQLDVTVEAKAIEITAEISNKADNVDKAREQHLRAIEELRSVIIGLSASLTSNAEQEMEIRRPKIARLQFAKPSARSRFTVVVTTDIQITQVAQLLNRDKNISILSYEVIYDPNIGTDEQLTTDLTEQLLEEIREKSKELGRTLTPRSFSRLDIDTQESGREELDTIMAGKKVQGWTPSSKAISLVLTSKRISIALRAS